MKLEDTYLEVCVLKVGDKDIFAHIENIYNDIYRDLVDVYNVKGDKEKRLKVIDLVKGRKISTLSELRIEILRYLTKFLNIYYAPIGSVYSNANMDELFFEIMDPVLCTALDKHRYDPIEVEEAISNGLPEPKYAVPGVKQVDEDSLQDLIDSFDAVITGLRTSLKRTSPHELIRFEVSPDTGWLLMSFWGDNRIHLYNDMVANGTIK